MNKDIYFSDKNSTSEIVCYFLSLLENGLFDENFIKEYSIPSINEELVRKYLSDWKLHILSHYPDNKNVEQDMWNTIKYFIKGKTKKEVLRQKKIKNFFFTFIK